MTVQFQAPPGWPQPPAGWQPDEGWLPDASWPVPPPGWRFWCDELGRTSSGPLLTWDDEPAGPGNVSPVPQWGTPSSARVERGGGTAPSSRAVARGRVHPGWWVCLVLFLVLLGALSSGVAGALISAGLTLLVLSVIAIVRGGVAWALIGSRRSGGWTAGGAVALLAIGGALSPAAAEQPASTVTADPAVTAAATPSTTPTSSASPVDPLLAAIAAAPAGSTLATLGELGIRAAGDVTGYTRSAFGPAWADIDRNGCDTRNDVLRRDLRAVVIKAGTGGCVVLSGTLIDQYTGENLPYVKGGATVSIDHVVALADAWRTGAQAWSVTKRAQFANDPLNLVSTSSAVNVSKGDQDAAGWLPAAGASQCLYVARRVGVKAKYGVWITPEERAAIGQVLQNCGSSTPPSAQPIPLMPKLTPTVKTTTAKPEPKPAPKPKPKPTGSSTPEPPTDVYYANCTQARAAGAAPLYQGEPGYRSGLDRDHDGVACE